MGWHWQRMGKIRYAPIPKNHKRKWEFHSPKMSSSSKKDRKISMWVTFSPKMKSPLIRGMDSCRGHQFIEHKYLQQRIWNVVSKKPCITYMVDPILRLTKDRDKLDRICRDMLSTYLQLPLLESTQETAWLDAGSTSLRSRISHQAGHVTALC